MLGAAVVVVTLGVVCGAILGTGEAGMSCGAAVGRSADGNDAGGGVGLGVKQVWLTILPGRISHAQVLLTPSESGGRNVLDCPVT